METGPAVLCPLPVGTIVHAGETDAFIERRYETVSDILVG